MKNLPRIHPEWVLVGVAALLIGILAAFFVWGTAGLAMSVEKAISPTGQGGVGVWFDLEGAKRLDLLIQR